MGRRLHAPEAESFLTCCPPVLGTFELGTPNSVHGCTLPRPTWPSNPGGVPFPLVRAKVFSGCCPLSPPSFVEFLGRGPPRGEGPGLKVMPSTRVRAYPVVRRTRAALSPPVPVLIMVLPILLTITLSCNRHADCGMLKNVNTYTGFQV